MKASEARQLADNPTISAEHLEKVLHDIKVAASKGWYDTIINFPATKLRTALLMEKLKELGYAVSERDSYTIWVQWNDQ